MKDWTLCQIVIVHSWFMEPVDDFINNEQRLRDFFVFMLKSWFRAALKDETNKKMKLEQLTVYL